ncbi:MAG TPA: acetylornithine/succinyldiaminopimelate transaminase [SAR86 cluster bacterium]|jgi:acetylornithine/N-succinyldiaminopimelate aminotransferase|nr:acetylornithine/succinyldiaminopimelate transaminase [SAR86 cluster bacterium]HJM15180.1 acetylornithine/succinyldiaminopimelate transaminase [SAR86 cluster bacterium]|tara:strand:- start:820 stop:2025 length:1206 start_codon:yes stop_codon:yes gene_type:complete
MNKKNDKNKELLSIYEDVMLPNYAPANFIPDRALGSRIWDKNNKEYIDLGGGIAVNSLGHSNPILIKTLNDQANKLWHTSNYLSNEPAINLAKKLTELTFAEKVYFSNSGSEANEAAIKIARKFHHDRGENRDELISFENSFHGRSILNISMGGSENHKKGFEPLLSGIKHAKYNDISSVENLISNKTAAIIIEPVQGEAGVYEADKSFLKSLRDLCDKNGTLLIMDEVQSGIGRTGHLYGYMKYGIEPDILTSAKGLGGGIPIGATLTKNNIAPSLSTGTHGSTFGGNPIACAVSNKVLEIVSNPTFLDEVQLKEKLMMDLLKEISSKTHVFSGLRSSGLWICCDIKDVDAFELLDRCYENGLILVTAGNKALRFAPALNISEDDISEGLGNLTKALNQI